MFGGIVTVKSKIYGVRSLFLNIFYFYQNVLQTTDEMQDESFKFFAEQYIMFDTILQREQCYSKKQFHHAMQSIKAIFKNINYFCFK